MQNMKGTDLTILDSGFYMVSYEAMNPFAYPDKRIEIRTDFLTIEKTRKNTYVTVEHSIGGGYQCSLSEYIKTLQLNRVKIISIES